GTVVVDRLRQLWDSAFAPGEPSGIERNWPEGVAEETAEEITLTPSFYFFRLLHCCPCRPCCGMSSILRRCDCRPDCRCPTGHSPSGEPSRRACPNRCSCCFQLGSLRRSICIPLTDLHGLVASIVW